jgi:hypothetical protein
MPSAIAPLETRTTLAGLAQLRDLRRPARDRSASTPRPSRVTSEEPTLTTSVFAAADSFLLRQLARDGAHELRASLSGESRDFETMGASSAARAPPWRRAARRPGRRSILLNTSQRGLRNSAAS